MENEEEFYKNLKLAEWNYEAKIIPRHRIREVLIDKILMEAKLFISLMTPFWTWGAVNGINLTEILKDLMKKEVNIFLFGRENVNPQFFHNIKIFRYFFFKLGIFNCWLIKNLHSKLYYNEKNILLTSANFTAKSLDVIKDDWNFNYEDAVLLKLKEITYDDKTHITFPNLNPFNIPPFYYIQNEEKIPMNRFLKGYVYKQIFKMEIPSLFSFPEMMRDWYLTTETSDSYNRQDTLQNKALIHLGEKEGFCPICKHDDCNFSRTFICHKYGVDYTQIANHCGHIIDCEMGSIFKNNDFYNQKCPITVFYCPNNKEFLNPTDCESIPEINIEKASFSENLMYPPEIYGDNVKKIFFCRSCKRLLENVDEQKINFEGEFGNDLFELYKCPNCHKTFLKNCPACNFTFPQIDLNNSYFYCENVNNEYQFHIEKV